MGGGGRLIIGSIFCLQVDGSITGGKGGANKRKITVSAKVISGGGL